MSSFERNFKQYKQFFLSTLLYICALNNNIYEIACFSTFLATMSRYFKLYHLFYSFSTTIIKCSKHMICPSTVRNRCWAGYLSLVLMVASLPHMSICTRVVIAIPFEQIDHSPYAQASAQRDYKYLQSVDCCCKKCHNDYRNPNPRNALFCRSTTIQTKQPCHSESVYLRSRVSLLSLIFIFFEIRKGSLHSRNRL